MSPACTRRQPPSPRSSRIEGLTIITSEMVLIIKILEFLIKKKQRLSQMFMVTINVFLYLSSSIWQKLSWVPQQIISHSTTNTIAFQDFNLDGSGPESLSLSFCWSVTLFWSIFGEVTSLCGNSRLYLTNSSKVKNTFLHVTQIMCSTAPPLKN